MMKFAYMCAVAFVGLYGTPMLAQGVDPNVFSDVELTAVANSLVRKYLECANLAQWVDSPNFRHAHRSKAFQKARQGLSIPEFMFTTKKSDAASQWDSSFVVMTTSFAALPPNYYVTAFGRDGSLYLLSGFDAVDFGALVKDRVGFTNVLADPTPVARLFLETVLYSPDNQETLIDSSNAKDYRGRAEVILVPTIRQTGDRILLDFFSVGGTAEMVRHHKVAIGLSSGSIDHELQDVSLSRN